MPLISVIIPTKNRASLLREALESVFALPQDAFTLEVLVIDDGSTDDTQQVAACFPVRYLTYKGSGRSAGARNAGLAAATGEYIAFLDDDDLWLPNHLAPHVRVLEQHPEYQAAIALVALADEEGRPYMVPRGDAAPTSGNLYEELLRDIPQLGAVVVRAAAARAIGDFDTALVGGQDWDWVLRIARRYPVARIPEAVVLFRQRGYADLALKWTRMPYTLRIFRMHQRSLPLRRRLPLERTFWKHRGYYASWFWQSAHYYAARGESAEARRSLVYAVRASPVHALLTARRHWLPGKRESAAGIATTPS